MIMKRPIRTAPIRSVIGGSFAALALTFTLAACSNDDMSGHDMDGSSPAAAEEGTSTEFNDADVMFAQMMIPHHEQAVSMSDMILKKDGIDPEVTELAEQIKAAQQPEIDTMTQWLTDWGRVRSEGDGEMEHEDGKDHGGDGMMTPAEMENLDYADAEEGQKLFLTGMIMHHEGAVAMAQTEKAEGSNPDAIELAEAVISAQQEEIVVMQDLLTRV